MIAVFIAGCGLVLICVALLVVDVPLWAICIVAAIGGFSVGFILAVIEKEVS